METEHLKEFLVMADTLNYTTASEKLFISQSSIFKHIRALETELGVTLFTRVGKSIRITEYGTMFIHHAKVMLKQLETYRTEVENNKTAQANVITTIDEYPNPEMLIAFRKAYPQYSVNQEFMKDSGSIFRSGCDFMTLRGDLPELEDEFDSIELTTDSVVVVTPPGHPLASRETVCLSDLKNEGFIGFSLSDQATSKNDKLVYLHDVQSMCRNAGFEPNIVMSAFPGSEVAKLVSQGGGISLLFKKATTRRIGSQVEYVNLEPEMTFRVKIYHRKNRPLSDAAMAYINFAQDWYEAIP